MKTTKVPTQDLRKMYLTMALFPYCKCGNPSEVVDDDANGAKCASCVIKEDKKKYDDIRIE